MPHTISDLAKKSCKACKSADEKLTEAKVQALLGELPGWQHGGDEINKTFQFKNYYESLAFVNATAWISHREDHHPDMEVGYNKVRMRYSTHSVGGLSENDFICAAKIELLLNI